jgi:hypothetical protein
MAADRKQIVRDSYAAFAAGDWSFDEQRLSDDFVFSAPPDPRLDDEVVVTYETDASGGGRGRNTEVFTFDDEDKITRTEVYFGWSLE